MKNKLLQKITTIIFLVIVFSLSIVNLAWPKKSFSENENRVLSPFPSLSISNVFSGNFDDQFETWFADHFMERNAWIQTKAATRISVGAIENNSVYLGADGRLIGAYTKTDETALKTNITSINEFAQENDLKVNVMIVPGSAYGQSNDLPDGAYNLNEKQIIQSIGNRLSDQNFIDVTDALSNQNDYFKTDHHWNEKGAYAGYKAICADVLNKQPETFTYTEVADDFKGTMYSKSGAFWTSGESIYRIDPSEMNDVTVTVDNGEVMNSLYKEENLKGKDKYTYYLDGNHGLEKIQTSVKNGKKAVIVKDSYAHILVPYLAQEYSEIDLVDLRYYRDAVSRLITNKDSTDVYVIYSLDEFASDKSLAALW